ncbi:RNase E specificity factor CsrD [Shewanella ulleungensis]|jgi:RNase E specificity factor CsrD|uniref:RNase E specificity factor CsrD n=1 Tax=Shewanella ulleungensis TaxID=2282699 RepID=A0ABQ2QQU1_9GAMM|nr:RNase E specificity factor CsrD [Shewanella ulleungensis]MCL1150217.1 RNase E specificity factor CsrD [Shewanella ulleungensis]GGP89004.1 RNase E specificity factor CsrD [Shewanella ulleungensis]
MKITKILTKKITSFWLLSLAAVAFVFLLCAIMSFIQLTYTFQQQKVTELETMLVAHSKQQDNSPLSTWLPPLLSAYNAVDFSLSQGDKLLYEYHHDNLRITKNSLTLYQNQLDNGLRLSLTMPPPFSLNNLGWYELIILIIGFTAIGIFVRFGYGWYSRELDGIEQLALRSKLILEGDLVQAAQVPTNGKPRMINRAISKLLSDLDDAHKERGRLDQFIRKDTFLDKQTQIGNGIFFQNRLDALSHNQKMIAHGVLMLIEFDDMDLVEEELGESGLKAMFTLTTEAITAVLAQYEDSIFARRSYQQLVIVIPQLSLTEADQLAQRVLKTCLALPFYGLGNPDNFLHLGSAFFKAGDLQVQLIEEAEMALRAAQLQRVNNWFMYDKGAVDEEIAKGSVRWRSFLENALVAKRFFTLQQAVVDSDNRILHYEVFSRARDNQGNDVRATLFIPMANKCGLMPQIERQILEQVLFGLMPKNDATYCINLSLDTLVSRAFVRWVQSTLLEHRPLASRLIFEVSEDIIVKHQSNPAFIKSLDMLRKMGAKLAVDHVGQHVVGTHYIQEHHFDLVKLHRSIVRQVHQRSENQLFIRSLIGGLYRAEVKVIAEGVECFEEWQTLKILGVSAAQGEYLDQITES